MSGEEKKVALVTGASAGIGAATALQFAELGYKVAVTGRNKERLREVLESMISKSSGKSPSDFLTIEANFEFEAQVDLIVELTVKRFGRLDVLVNNAGYSGRRRDLGHGDFYDDFKSILQVNLMAPMRISQLATPYLLKTHGVIINISSVADRFAMPNISYSVSKAGLSMLTKCLANALDATGCRVVGVAPGPIKTNFAAGIERIGPMTGLMRAGESAEVANLIVFLSSEKASFIHGCNVDIDGGFLSKFGGFFTMMQQKLHHEVSKEEAESSLGRSSRNSEESERRKRGPERSLGACPPAS